MYSFSPLPDLSYDHTEFYMFCVTCLMLAGYITVCFGDGEFGLPVFVVGQLFVCASMYYAYYCSYAPFHPVNEQVIGKFVAAVPDVYRRREGKRDVEHHALTVTYAVPGGDVTLGATYGIVYPRSVILYKN